MNYDLTKMDLEGLTYSSDLLRKTREKLCYTASQLDFESLDDAEKVRLAKLQLDEVMDWLLKRILDNNEAFNYQIENMFSRYEEENHNA